MNGGRQLSFLTICSDVFDNSADLNLELIGGDEEAPTDEDDEYLTFQLCEGESMNNEMANFIGLHMLNDGCLDSGVSKNPEEDADGGQTFQCPETGCHFEFTDI